MITIGGEDDLLCDRLRAEDVCWVSGVPSEGEIDVEAQVRYRAHAGAGDGLGEGIKERVRFDEPQKAITPGQAVVFYEGERVLGGGIIAKSIPSQAGHDGRVLTNTQGGVVDESARHS